MRGTTNTNVRGSAEGRRRRKQALLNRDGDGTTAPCWECATPVTARTMVADRVVPGCRGGTYRLSNLRTHCRACSEAQGRRMSAETRRWKSWQRRGLRRSRLAPDGQLTPYWNVYLAGDWAGYVVMTAAGTWVRGGECTACAVGGHETMRAALYALLVEYTQSKKERQAA